MKIIGKKANKNLIQSSRMLERGNKLTTKKDEKLIELKVLLVLTVLDQRVNYPTLSLYIRINVNRN